MNNFKNKIPIIAGILFLMANVIAVLSAWITDTHRYDLGISFSSYVGLSRPTSVVWFVSAVIIITMLIYYIAKIKIILFKKIIYAVVLLCIFGTALFPYNFYSEAPTAITINLHNDFAICLMLVTTVSFILSAIFSKSKKQEEYLPRTQHCLLLHLQTNFWQYFSLKNKQTKVNNLKLCKISKNFKGTWTLQY